MAKEKKRKKSARKPAAPPYQVFVSHATADKFMARMVDDLLQRAGITTFRDDRDIESGERIPEGIRREIVRCDEFVVVWTTQTLSSEWVKQEIGAAWGHGKRIIALLHVVGPETLPPNVQDCKALPINDVESYIREASRRARKR